ncbi:unnamed protein product [Boreogadus saida]
MTSHCQSFRLPSDPSIPSQRGGVTSCSWHDVEDCFSNGYSDTGVASGPGGWLRVACGVLMGQICAGCQSAVLRCQSTPQRRQPKQAVVCSAGSFVSTS